MATESFESQLVNASVVLDLRPDLVYRASLPSLSGDEQGPTRSVLLFGRAADEEFSMLERVLPALGVPVYRIMAEKAANIDISLDIGRNRLYLDGRRIDPALTWIRHFSVRAIPEDDADSVTLFRRDSWAVLMEQLSSFSRFTIDGRGPGAISQLTAAKRLGVKIPETVISTGQGALCPEITSGPKIAKALDAHFVETNPGLLVGVFPQIFQFCQSRAGLDAAIRGAPFVLQEYIEASEEFRVYFVAGEIVCYQIFKEQASSLWADANGVRVRPVPVPEVVDLAARTLASEWNIKYCAFDFLLSGGSATFLEANFDGDWRWFEMKAATERMDVSAAVVRMILAFWNAPAPDDSRPE
jgi:hypothetical protein